MSIGAQAVTDGGETRAGVVLGEVLREGLGAAAVGLDRRHHGSGVAGFLLGAGVVDGEACAHTGERQGDGATDFAARTGDQGGAAVQAERVKRIVRHGLILCSGSVETPPPVSLRGPLCASQ